MNQEGRSVSDAEVVDTEIAKTRWESMQSQCYAASAGIQGFRASDIIANAESKSVYDILVQAGVCSASSLYNTLANNLYEAMADLADQGVIDIGYLDDEMEDEDEE